MKTNLSNSTLDRVALSVIRFARQSAPAVAVVTFLIVSARAAVAGEFHGKPYQGDDLFADTWVATDAAGRAAPGFKECGPVKANKWVGIFYWTWHRPQAAGPNDTTKILAQANGGLVHWPTNNAPYHWGEPDLETSRSSV